MRQHGQSDGRKFKFIYKRETVNQTGKDLKRRCSLVTISSNRYCIKEFSWYLSMYDIIVHWTGLSLSILVLVDYLEILVHNLDIVVR
jgi:hypothetical protein